MNDFYGVQFHIDIKIDINDLMKYLSPEQVDAVMVGLGKCLAAQQSASTRPAPAQEGEDEADAVYDLKPLSTQAFVLKSVCPKCGGKGQNNYGGQIIKCSMCNGTGISAASG